MSTREEMVEKVKKILAKTRPGSGATMDEAASAAAMAQRLIQKYKIDAALLEERSVEAGAPRKADAPIDQFTIYTFEGMRIVTWKLYLADAVAAVNGVKTFYRTGGYGKPGTIHGIGTLDDVEMTKLMLTLIMAEIEKLYKEERPKGLSQGDAKSWGHSFRNGAVDTIRRRLNEAWRALRNTTENETRWRELYALGDPQLSCKLDEYLAKETDAIQKDLPGWARERLQQELDSGGARALVVLGKATDAASPAVALQRAVEWTQKHIRLEAGAARSTIGVSGIADRARGLGEHRSQYGAFEKGKEAGYRADLEGHKRKRIEGGE